MYQAPAGAFGGAVGDEAEVYHAAGGEALQGADAGEGDGGDGGAGAAGAGEFAGEIADEVPGSAVDLILPVAVGGAGAAAAVVHGEGGEGGGEAGGDGKAEGDIFIAADAGGGGGGPVGAAPGVAGSGAGGSHAAAAGEAQGVEVGAQWRRCQRRGLVCRRRSGRRYPRRGWCHG